MLHLEINRLPARLGHPPRMDLGSSRGALSPDHGPGILSIDATAWGGLSSSIGLRKLQKTLDWSDSAVVGSSGNLRGTHRGREIDAHSLVLRLNDAPTAAQAGFKKSVGQRTDVRLLTKKLYLWLTTGARPNQWQASVLGDERIIEAFQVERLPPFLPGRPGARCLNVNGSVETTPVARDPRDARCDESVDGLCNLGGGANERCLAFVAEDWVRNLHGRLLAGQGASMTTGFQGVLLAVAMAQLTRGNPPSIYGFGPCWSCGKYYDCDGSNATFQAPPDSYRNISSDAEEHHPVRLEWEVLRNLSAANAIRLYEDDCGESIQLLGRSSERSQYIPFVADWDE